MSNVTTLKAREPGSPAAPHQPASSVRPSAVQRAWLARGLGQPGGKLPLFDEHGQRVSPRTIKACIEQGWAAPWFENPTKPDWLVCKLTDRGRAIAGKN